MDCNAHQQSQAHTHIQSHSATTGWEKKNTIQWNWLAGLSSVSCTHLPPSSFTSLPVPPTTPAHPLLSTFQSTSATVCVRVCVCRVPLLMAFTVTESEKITRRKKATTPCGTKRNEMAAKAENSVAVAAISAAGCLFCCLLYFTCSSFWSFLLDEFLLFVTFACGNLGLTSPLPHQKTCLKRRVERKKERERDKTTLSSITPRAVSRHTLLLWAFNLFHQPFLFLPLSQSFFPLSVHKKTICA